MKSSLTLRTSSWAFVFKSGRFLAGLAFLSTTGPNWGLAEAPVLAIQQRRPQAFKHAERWQSGRSRRTRNAKYAQAYRGFESLPLRQSLLGFWQFLTGFLILRKCPGYWGSFEKGTIAVIEVHQREGYLELGLPRNSLLPISVVNTSPKHNRDMM